MTIQIKHKLTVVAGTALAFMLLWSACKEPSPLGAELLGNEYADLAFTDTVEVQCFLERELRSLTSDRTSSADYFICGTLNDPTFGKSKSDIFALALGETLNPAYKPATQTFDSIVLYLAYDLGGFYGDTTKQQNLRVYRMDDNQYINDGSDYYSDQQFSAGEEIGSRLNFYPHPNTADSLFEGIEGNFIRVTLSQTFGNFLFNLDSATYSVDSLFIKAFRGLKITASGADNVQPGLMMAFDLNNSNLSRIRLYYHDNADTTLRNFDYFFKGVNKFTYFEHDTSSAVYALKDQQLDDKIYVQGMQGYRVRVAFPYAHKLDRIAVNQAQLVLNVDDDGAGLASAGQLFFTKYIDTLLASTSDVAYSFGSNGTGGFVNFGGTPKKVVENGTTLTRYRLTLSEEFQHFVDDDESPDIKNRTVYLGVYPRSRTAARSILFGPKSLSFPAKLELTYTRVP